MFRKITNSGLICILHADNDAPLKLWDKKIRDGRLKRVSGSDINGLLLEFTGKMPYGNYLACPSNMKAHLGIRYPYMVVTAKAAENKFFAFDVQVLDEAGARRRFRLATGLVSFEVHPFYCKIPLVMEEDWNNIVVPLHHLTREVYGTRYMETLRLQIYPSCLIKKVYFADRDYDEDDLPAEFQHHHSIFLDHFLRRKYDDVALSPVRMRPATPQICLSRKGTSETVNKRGKYSAREVIPRVIPINYGGKNSPRETYSSL